MAEKVLEPNKKCGSPIHTEHLCNLMFEGIHYTNPEKYKAIVQGAEYRCQDCARTAKSASNLCSPVKL